MQEWRGTNSMERQTYKRELQLKLERQGGLANLIQFFSALHKQPSQILVLFGQVSRLQLCQIIDDGPLPHLHNNSC